MKLSRAVPWILVLAVSSVGVPGWAQSFNGSISGAVKDPSGAIVGGAELVLKNQAKGVAEPVWDRACGVRTVPDHSNAAFARTTGNRRNIEQLPAAIVHCRKHGKSDTIVHGGDQGVFVHDLPGAGGHNDQVVSLILPA